MAHFASSLGTVFLKPVLSYFYNAHFRTHLAMDGTYRVRTDVLPVDDHSPVRPQRGPQFLHSLFQSISRSS